MTKPYSASCERNWRPIADVLKKLVQNKSQTLFEVGSGTGQHAVYIALNFQNLLGLHQMFYQIMIVLRIG